MKKTRRYAGLSVLCALTVFLSGCSIFGDGGKADVKVDFGQYQNTSEAGKNEESKPETDSTASEDESENSEGGSDTDTSQDESTSDSGYEADADLMEEFYKSEFSGELLSYFEENGRGEEAFSQPIFDSENKIYSQEELDQLSDVMCKIFRNEIYARHGMIFGDEDLNQLYGPFSWYKGTISLRDFEAQEELPFNATEYANIKNVVAVEKARKER